MATAKARRQSRSLSPGSHTLVKARRLGSHALSWTLLLALAALVAQALWPLLDEPARALLREALAGWTGGLVGMVAVYPLDTAKLRLQTSKGGVYRGVLDTICAICREEGIQGLYRGILSPALGFGAIFGTTFCTYPLLCGQLRLRHSTGELLMTDRMLAGFVSGCTSSVPRAAFERVKSLIQAGSGLPGAAPKYRNAAECFAAIVQREGLTGLFRGLPSTLAREGPQQLVYFPAFHLVSELLAIAGLDRVLPVCMLLIPGAAAGIATWLPPFIWIDAVNSHMQCHEAVEGEAPASFLKCALDLYRARGAPHFNRGLGAALLLAAPLHATIFAVQGGVSAWLLRHGL